MVLPPSEQHCLGGGVRALALESGNVFKLDLGHYFQDLHSFTSDLDLDPLDSGLGAVYRRSRVVNIAVLQLLQYF